MNLGKAFSDSLIVEQKREKRRVKDRAVSWWFGAGRALLLATGLSVSLFLLWWQLFRLTIVDGRQYRKLSDGNRMRELIRHAPRGILRDRTGKALVENIPQYRLLRLCDGSTKSLCTRIVGRSEGEALSAKGLSPGEFLEIDWRREYLYPEALAHVVGYTGEISQEELADEYYALRNYLSGDRLGRMGAEAVFEERLRGRDGRELVEVDAGGTLLRTLGRDEEHGGEDIILALDANLSQAVAEAFPKGAKGAVVVSKPHTGELLALYSSPTYQSNAFSLGMSPESYAALMNDPDRPMFHRAIGGAYPPGSTFKIVSALAALEERAITEVTTVEDNGELIIGPYRFPNWYFIQYGKTEGTVDVVKALQRSNDIFFYKAGEWLGITKLVVWARRLGVGAPLGVELAGEAGGLMPDPAWKDMHFTSAEDLLARNNEWYLGDTYHVAIGQGYLLTTPLQVNAWTNVIANGGKLCKPTILKAQSSSLPVGKAGLKAQKEQCKDLKIKKETIDLITEGMQKACETGGTGWPLFNFNINYQSSDIKNEHQDEASGSAHVVKKNIPVACKTGTAEFGDLDNRTHAWFTAFAPMRENLASKGVAFKGSPEQEVLTGEPEISVTVLVEGAGEGSSVAGPIVKKIMEEWFRR